MSRRNKGRCSDLWFYFFWEESNCRQICSCVASKMRGFAWMRSPLLSCHCPMTRDSGGWFCCYSDVIASYNEADNMSIKAGFKRLALWCSKLLLCTGWTSDNLTRGRLERIKMLFLNYIPIVVIQLTLFNVLHGKTLATCKHVETFGWTCRFVLSKKKKKTF